MTPVRRAVIDVGTNSVKLLVADVYDDEIRPVREESTQTRLGQGFYETRRLQPEAIAATAEATAKFAAAARQDQASRIRVLATSAAREAVNSLELTEAIQVAAGLQVEIISGDQEALLGLKGVQTDPQLAQSALLLLDVGGGSTQCILGDTEQITFRRSFALGTVRLLEMLPCSDPPKPEELRKCRRWLSQFLQEQIPQELRQALQGSNSTANSGMAIDDPSRFGGAGAAGVALVGVGGTASILGCMEAKLERFDRQRLEATRLSAGRVSWHVDRLWSLPLAERQQTPGLPKNRADVILMGVAIYEAVMDVLGSGELRISTRGLRFAALSDAAKAGDQRSA